MEKMNPSKYALSIFIISCAVLALMSYDSCADEYSQPIGATVTVLGAGDPAALETGYGMSFLVSPDSIYFGTVAPDAGSTSSEEVSLSCETNYNHPWELYIRLDDPLNSNTSVIPLGYVRWQAYSDNAAGHLVSDGYIDRVSTVFYTSSIDEYITTQPVDITLYINVNIPENQAAGSYSAAAEVGMRDKMGSATSVNRIQMSLDISPKLTLSLSTSEIDFGDLRAGTTTETKNVTFYCSSNTDTPWSVSIESVSELATSTAYVIPNSNFRWSVNETGYGSIMRTYPVTFYHAGASEYVTSEPVELNMSFYVAIPEKQPSGAYSTTLIVTITEDSP
ncbi:MAG: hypothetical protein JW800_04975 [Candidatus Omnitrophica bacterium]|nr:hypothetical protein [Candidatus Omnitrophota bacterium]